MRPSAGGEDRWGNDWWMLGEVEGAVLRNYALDVSEFNATTKCRECEIFIGTGHSDAIPIAAPDGIGYFCRACYQAELRRQRPGWRAVNWAAY